MEEKAQLKKQLKAVREAIERIEMGAQKYTIGNRSLERGDLATLYKREQALKAAIARLDGNDLFFSEFGTL